MNKSQCEVSQGGFLGMGAKECGRDVSFRCPNCGKAICNQHAIKFYWRWSAMGVEGRVCSENCLKGLFANGSLTKTWFHDHSVGELTQWGGMKVTYSVDGVPNGGDFNGRPMTGDPDYYAKCAPYSSSKGYEKFSIWLKNKT